MDIHTLIDHFMLLNDNGESIQMNPEYFGAGFQLLVAASNLGDTLDEKELIISSLLFSHPNWFDHQVSPASFL